MRIPLSPHHVFAAATAAVAVGLSPFVLSGGTGSLPAAPHVPAAIVAAGRIKSAVAAATTRPARPHYVRATAVSVAVSSQPRPTAQRAVPRHVRHAVKRRHLAPIVVATPAAPVHAAPVVAAAAAPAQVEQRGKSATRSKGRRAAEIKQSHGKGKPPAAPSGSPGHGDPGHGNQGQGGGRGRQGGK